MGFTQSLPLVADQLRQIRQGQLYTRKIRLASSPSSDTLTWVLTAQGGAAVVVVKHVGGERSLEFIPVGVLDHLFLYLLFLFLLRAQWFEGSCSCAHSSRYALLVLLGGLFLVFAAGLRLFYS